MKALGEAAMDLPWLSPSVAALVALTRPSSAQIWPIVRHDPGALLLLARSLGSPDSSFLTVLKNFAPLETAHRFCEQGRYQAPNWNQPGPRQVLEVCQKQARLAELIARQVEGCDPEK